jgi:hypothetical protein
MSGAVQGVALYLTWALVVSSLGLTVYQWQTWALFALVWAVGQHERQQGREETSTVMIIALKNMGVDVDQLIKAMTSEK